MSSQLPEQERRAVRSAWTRSFAVLIVLIAPLTACQRYEVAESYPLTVAFSPNNPEAIRQISLTECVQIAVQRHPRLAALRASYVAAQEGQRALEDLRFPANLDPQIPVRRRQACLGLSASAAAVDEAERETIYAVARMYFTVLYAREQETVTKDVMERLKAAGEIADRAVKMGARNATAADVSRTTIYLRLAETKHTQAVQGVKRAMAALREAIGYGADFGFEVPVKNLTVPTAKPVQAEIIAAALARRADLVQANVYAQVAGLEVEAQGTRLSTRMPTFAGGTDIHAHQIPQAESGQDYKPSAIPPEMPTFLIGSRQERIQHAQSLSARAANVVETTRNLITLEAEDAFIRWEEAEQQVRQSRSAYEEGDKLAEDLAKGYAAQANVKVEDVLTTRVLAAQARSQYNEYLYRLILALADLERITAGGFCAGLLELAQ